MKIVTSGQKYLDIDAYGGMIAYAELLNLLGDEAIAASSAPLNESITPTIKSWKTDLRGGYQPTINDMFIIIDLSDPDQFDTIVDHEMVSEIIDHHMEFLDQWSRQSKTKVQIEFIGAACTLIFERWQQAGRLSEISQTSARLLIAGILDNTLNFEAGVTTARDRTAYKELINYAQLPLDWPAQYFEECQRTIMDDLKTAVNNDVKIMEFPSLKDKLATGQLVVWNASFIIEDHLADLKNAMQAFNLGWFMNIVSIEESKNYIVSDDSEIQVLLSNLLGINFVDSVAMTDRLWLRKEIMKADLDANK